jgi:hypothetical protein
MSTTDNSPDPRTDPEAFIRDEFDGLKHVLEAIANGGFDELSDDAAAILGILGQDGGETA